MKCTNYGPFLYTVAHDENKNQYPITSGIVSCARFFRSNNSHDYIHRYMI